MRTEGLKLPGGGLVVSRNVGESVVIADDIIVTVVEVKSGKCRLHFAAPRDIPIDRMEVHEAKKNGPV